MNFMKSNLFYLNFTRKRLLLRQIIMSLFAGIPLSLGVVDSAASNLGATIISNAQGISTQAIQDEPLSEDYEVWINGIKATVYVARVQDPPYFQINKNKPDVGGNYSFTSFDISGPTEIKIRSLKKSLKFTILRPDQARVKRLVKSEHEISFTINKPIKLSIEPDGKNAPLLLFANPVIDYKPVKGEKDLIYYGPGIHKPDSALIRLRDNQTLYLAEGAIVKATVIVSGNNTTICGRGILDGNEFVWGTGVRNSVLIRGNNVVVKDIIIRGAAEWTIRIQGCNNIVIDNVKILNGRAVNDDGINPVNAQDVLVKNCFVRTDDDCLAFKGTQSPPNNKSVERITVENTILWCNRSRVFLLGHESRAEYMRDITFRNIDIIHAGVMTIFLLEPGEEMKLQNVLFENIRINGEGQKELIRLKPVVNQYMRTKVPGYINDITFKNITVTGKIAGDYSIQLTGADEKHIVSGVVMSGISITGNKIKTGAKNLKIDNYVYKVSIK